MRYQKQILYAAKPNDIVITLLACVGCIPENIPCPHKMLRWSPSSNDVKDMAWHRASQIECVRVACLGTWYP